MQQNAIRDDPASRKYFFSMCSPLVIESLRIDKEGFWASSLGLSDFYYELAVKVAEVCISTRQRNGGINSVNEVRKILLRRLATFRFGSLFSKYPDSKDCKDNKNNTQPKLTVRRYSTDDIIRAVDKLTLLKSGFRTVKFGSNVMILSFL